MGTREDGGRGLIDAGSARRARRSKRTLLVLVPLVAAAVSLLRPAQEGGASLSDGCPRAAQLSTTGTFRFSAPLLEARAQSDGVQLLVADPRNGGAPLALDLPSSRCDRAFSAKRRRQLRAARMSFASLCGRPAGAPSSLQGAATVVGVGPRGRVPGVLLGFSSLSCAGAPDASLVAVGDIASCRTRADDATAKLAARLTGTIAALGDNAYESGRYQEFERCYGPSWGRLKARTRPAAGNHEYGTPGAAGYFRYFGALAGPRGKGYYSYDLGRWHIVVVNSNCDEVGGCGAQSPQGRWLRDDLVEHPALCTLAYWHHPRFSSGTVHGSSEYMAPIWQILFAAGADVVVSGHEHNYERFAPQTPQGKPDGSLGIREFVVGTGGRNVGYPFGKPLPTSEVRRSNALGVLLLQLHPGGYDWRFLSVPGRSFSDHGSASCH